MNKLVLSHSKIADYFKCIAKFSYLHVSKKVKFVESPETQEGKNRHEVIEKYCTNQSYDLLLKPQDRIWADKIVKAKGRKYYEYPFIITTKYDRAVALERVTKINGYLKYPTIPQDALIRGSVDALIINNQYATIVDWKTGKKPGPKMSYHIDHLEPLRDGTAQLDVYALATFLLFPEVFKIKGSLVWLNQNCTTDKVYDRKDLPSLIEQIKHFYEVVRVILDNYDSHELEKLTSPSKLCEWCGAKNICKDAQILQGTTSPLLETDPF